MLTATERAEAMALQVLIFARLHNGRVVTRDVVDAVMSRDADTEQGKANKETVRRIIRARAESERVRVIFTEVERYWAIREQLHHMSDDQVHDLRDEIVEGGDRDLRGWDKKLTDAISARLSNRPSPMRLRGVEPVSIRLWSTAPAKLEELPTTDDVVDAPHAVYVGEERKHVRTENGTTEIIPTRQALDEIDAAMMQPLVKRTVKHMSASKSTAHIVYRDGRTVYLRPATPGDLFPALERPTDAELTGDIDAGLSAYYAETFQEIADGLALPVRADMLRPGMDVIHAHMGETRTVDAVTAFVGPGAPWVRPTWTFRSHDESTTGSTYPPEMHLMVTRASLDTVFGPAPAEHVAPAAPVDEKTRRWAEGFAAKWWAEQNTGEPTDAALAAVFTHTVKPPKREAYPLIREAITALTPPAAAAPLFAALAAREAADEAADLTPRALSTLAHHLETLPLAAPPALHERLRAAQHTAECAWEALRFAHNLPAKNAARSAAKDAIVRARAAILAVQPHAGRMHGTDMPHTTDSIRAAALAYMHLGATPDETDAIKSGTAEVRVDCRPDTGTGWMVTARITAGIRDVAWFLPAHPPIVVKFRRVDGRESPAANARKVIGSMLRVDVPVKYKDAARR